MCDVFNLISLSWYRPHPPPPLAAKTDQDETSVISHLRWCPGVGKTSGAARKSKYRDQSATISSWHLLSRMICSCVFIWSWTFWIYVSRFSEINNWSEAHSMGSGNKASSERETKNCDAMWNNFFLIEWSRVHHQYHFLLLLCDITRPIHLVWASLHHSS